MKKYRIEEIVMAFATAASILSLAFISEIPLGIRWIIFIIGFICFGIIVKRHIFQVRDQYIECETEEETREYMRRWISSQGKVCVVSRDLSWVDEKVKQQMLKKKESLVIFAQNKTGLTEELSEGGVIVRYYGDKFNPTTRFTVIRYNREDRQIAIATPSTHLARRNAYTHTIYQSGTSNDDTKDKWIVSLAVDLIVALGELCNLKGG